MIRRFKSTSLKFRTQEFLKVFIWKDNLSQEDLVSLMPLILELAKKLRSIKGKFWSQIVTKRQENGMNFRKDLSKRLYVLKKMSLRFYRTKRIQEKEFRIKPTSMSQIIKEVWLNFYSIMERFYALRHIGTMDHMEEEKIYSKSSITWMKIKLKS